MILKSLTKKNEKYHMIKKWARSLKSAPIIKKSQYDLENATNILKSKSDFDLFEGVSDI